MDEAEWLACADPASMLEFVRNCMSDRQLRLFACACCRRIWGELDLCVEIDDEQRCLCREAVPTAERHADGLAAPEDLIDWRGTLLWSYSAPAAFVGAVAPVLDASEVARCAAEAAAYGAQERAYPSAGGEILGSDEFQGCFDVAYEAEEGAQAGVLRCVSGHVFRPIHVPSGWRTPTVTSLAATAYEERALPGGDLDNQQLAILADALEDAGCTDAAILDHLRGPGPHVRGCFALDLVLGKS